MQATGRAIAYERAMLSHARDTLIIALSVVAAWWRVCPIPLLVFRCCPIQNSPILEGVWMATDSLALFPMACLTSQTSSTCKQRVLSPGMCRMHDFSSLPHLQVEHHHSACCII